MSNPKQINDVAAEPSVELTPKQEAFCLAFLEENNAACAYRRAYDVGEHTPPKTVWEAASRLMAENKVASRILELRAAAAKEVICGVVDLMRDWYDIATANPNELVKTVTGCCRYCHGENFKYQWRDEEEWIDACNKACLEAKKNADPIMPEFDGGVGFHAYKAPNVLCPHCYGVGIAHTLVQDTTKLGPKARKLYKGAKQNRYGEIEIEMHDQQKARESLARCLGAFNDKLIIPKAAGTGETKAIDEGVSPQDAARLYQDMLNG